MTSILADIRDPAVVLVCLGMVLYLRKDYVSKETYNDLKKTVYEMQKDYVSKEKLSDVIDPFARSLAAIVEEIKEIKDFIINKKD